MKTNVKLTKLEKIENFLTQLENDNKLDIDLVYYLNGEEINDFDELTKLIDNQKGFNQDVIYYQTAIEYLMENDNSLQESFEIAADLGYELTNLNSEVLASLLKTQNCRNDWYNLENEVNEFLNELNDNE